ncbi:YihY/virulence factor BrkB family protein [Roseomonas marmotae]|uniref:YihY/virulence factor BrkB family protein n=1 Tax=Roseomonas marmotae TaxID=2768161 RepID=A0ABS3KCL2_9PROT|nr:YihY/virulence factor BrkB family protein [Roseomonas marmotae]MBO1074091.1 YihY/virulence factor BrkB family protein [Roseomonas marmotae]QTI78874.1 YihY/virulence factor BrkB family protein [Roseomonas marmotae]
MLKRLAYKIWWLARQTVLGFIDDEALSRGAAIAFYTVTSLAPVLIIAVAIAGLAFGEDAARGAVVEQLGGLMGQAGAEVVQDIIRSASNPTSGMVASVIGIVTLLITASGVFGEIQASLNKIWRAEVPDITVSSLLRARALSLGLVATLGFLLLVSLVISALLAALRASLNTSLPGIAMVVRVTDIFVSLGLVSALIAAIYKILPDRRLEWRDVVVGAIVTAGLFDLGKMLIGLYLGRSAIGSTYGAAGSVIVVLLWIYYSAQIFLLGAEFTKAHAMWRDAQAWHLDHDPRAPKVVEPEEVPPERPPLNLPHLM